ncbi:hypothetical protein BpHYR1_008070 [Brachionus plicatilis]|uniref:Uncharacterized protein n=1 Tax=Brachionus plicatilis TaxID=10195 RepID=A0A3M7PQM2_BRAPC|nr:hypothetical protein BpHYR1_008070 [Brachionus plicatilis]
MTSHKSIPYLSQKISKSSLPPNNVNLIKELRKVRRNFQKTRCQKLKQSFNQLTSELEACYYDLRSSNSITYQYLVLILI